MEYVALPGVLARGPEQYLPLYGVLPPKGREFAYRGLTFDFEHEVTRIANYIECGDTSSDIVVIGSSFGGMLVPFVVEALSYRFDRERLKVVIVDGPAGLETIMDANARFLANKFVANLAVGVTSALRLKVPVGDDMLPKPDEISADLDTQAVVETARTSLKGHGMGMLLSQTALMIRVVKDGSLARACASLADVDTTYLACVHAGNGVIRQPLAADWWTMHLSGLKVEVVAATHCGYLQNQPEFMGALRKILAI